jgi:outer membrane receptor protein involved in Fe transport
VPAPSAADAPAANGAPAPLEARDPNAVGADGLTDADRALLDASEVISIDHKSDGEVLRESARAVTVVDTRVARERAADLGEVLSRTPGIQVRRAGGLGSVARFSLNGLYDDQVRFFLDGVPLQLAGWGIGIANVPVELIQRVDVYRGVVPIALGADALGGAIDLVTDPSWVSRASASMEIGSFGTDRGSLMVRSRDDATGLVAGLTAFLDRALNDYPINVEVPDERGRPQPVRVRRFHDGYLAAGTSAELGVVDRGPVRRAIARFYTTQYNKDLQHNLVMTVPYGEAGYGEAARGATLDTVVEHAGWQLRALIGLARRRIEFHDTATQVYDWFGNAIRDRETAGETAATPTHQVVTETSWFGRLVGERALGEHQRLRLAIAPTVTRRTGENLLAMATAFRDPIDAKRNLAQLVTGLEHELDAAEIQNVAFVKHYAMWTDAEDVVTGNVFVPIKQDVQRFGVGDGVRWRARDWLSFKASYEWATRLPSVDELFGDGKLIDPNLQLAPETSHNVNLEAVVRYEGALGALTAQTDLFGRAADHLILPIGTDRRFSNQNVWDARILGVEGSGRWTAPREWAWVEGSVTFQDLRNVSSEGTFGAYKGDRIPNRPWLLGSLGATVRTTNLLRSGDELSGFASSRYVHQVFRGWESLGRRDSKQIVPSQLVHGAGITYALRGLRSYTATLEVQNLTDTVTYDSFGAVKPGRAGFLKLGVEL